MRITQKEYFKNRDKGVLGQSKTLERQVDKYIFETAQSVQTALELGD
jgi:hypothetical protein